MMSAWRRKPTELQKLTAALTAVRERSELLDDACGIGLWGAAIDGRAMGALAAGLVALAQGDLTHRITAEPPAKTRKLRDDFNAAVGQMIDTVGRVVANTAAIRSGTGEIAHAADDLSRRTARKLAPAADTEGWAEF